jgi:hypothetical protein
LTAAPGGFRPDGTGHIVLAGIVLCFVAAFAFFGYLSAGLFRPTAVHPRQSPPVPAAAALQDAATRQRSAWDIVNDPDPTQFMGTEDESDGAWTRP